MIQRAGGVAALLVAAAVSSSCTARTAIEAPADPPVSERAPGPRTRAERTEFRETSSYADVTSFLDSLVSAGAKMHRFSMGRTVEGRPIPVVVASRPLVRTPDEAKRLGRPIVYVQGNIHAGEVEGKEALQALLRDLTLAPGPNALDSVVLIAVPIYNADGNERLASQSVNRTEQNGPEMVGVRSNAGGLDLNRDYMKADAPETRAALALLDSWDPDVFVDLHTTNGSYHGYGLTYSPSLHPAAVHGGPFARDELLPELRRRAARRGLTTFDYGNFSLRYGSDFNTDTVRQGWWTYDHRPRFGTNYFGLRGGVAILAEAYSHDPFERRVQSMSVFVSELLSLVAERGPAVRALTARAASARVRPDPATPPTAGSPARASADSGAIAIRARLTTSPNMGEVLAEDIVSTGDSSVSEPGMPPGLRRTGRFRTLRIPVYDRFEATRTVRAPHAYAIDISQSDLVPRLLAHGIEVHRLTSEWTSPVDLFEMDSVIVAPRPFQWHREHRLEGRWVRSQRAHRAGSWIVPVGQPLGALAVYLLEPESDDGLAAWNLVAPRLEPGSTFPVARVPVAPDMSVLTRVAPQGLP